MLNIHELESKWLRYKIKSYIPHMVILVSTLIIFSVALSLYSTQLKENIMAVNIPKKDLTIKKVILPDTTLKEINKTTLPLKYDAIKEQMPQQQVTMQPSLNFMKNIKEYVVVKAPLVEVVKEKIVIPKPIVVAKKVIPSVKEEVYQEPDINITEKVIETPPKEEKKDKEVVKIEKKSVITISRQNTHDDIQHVIKRFKKSNNPALSLFAAKKYYELGEYNEAYNYALITNELNNDIEESWIIFAKALTKLGEKEKAMAILKKYISNSHSQRAQILLRNIKSGQLQ